MKIETKSPAKINLYLKILSKRKDGYHNIKTLFQYIDLYDVLIFKKSQKGISIKSENIVFNQKNTVLQAANKMKQYLSNSYGVSIEIDKNIPIGSGLGGASSNAASTILALNKLWDLKLSKEKMLSIGKELGADVPFLSLVKMHLEKA